MFKFVDLEDRERLWGLIYASVVGHEGLVVGTRTPAAGWKPAIPPMTVARRKLPHNMIKVVVYVSRRMVIMTWRNLRGCKSVEFQMMPGGWMR